MHPIVYNLFYISERMPFGLIRMNPTRFTFIGLGLIGGSIAKALRKYMPDCTIAAYMPDPSKLIPAKEDHVVDIILSDFKDISGIKESISDISSTMANSKENPPDIFSSMADVKKDPSGNSTSMPDAIKSHLGNSLSMENAIKSLHALVDTDIFFLCAPVESNISYLEKLRPYLKQTAILTDVGSTKSSIHKAVHDLQLDDYFIGGHPMAGSERTGYLASDPLIIENAYYMLTPSVSVSGEKYDALVKIIHTIKSIPFAIDFEKHDFGVAAISHLPHIIASCLVNLVKSEDEDDLLKKIAAGGFKDITRIAASSPVMWDQICETNKSAILLLLGKYIQELSTIRRRLEEHIPNTVHDMFVSSREYRNSISDIPFGLIHSDFSFSVKVADKPGAISIVSAILAANSISIKNIGINHNRELGEGALHISFSEANACDLAKKILTGYNYEIEV